MLHRKLGGINQQLGIQSVLALLGCCLVIPSATSLHTKRVDLYLEESCEDVELEVGDEVVAGEIDGGLERHRLQPRPDRVNLAQRLTEVLPRNYRPETPEKCYFLIKVKNS